MSWPHHLAHWAPLVFQTVKNLPANAEDRDSIPWSGRSPGEGNSYLLQNFCLENLIDRGAWWATDHGVAKELDTAEQLTHLTQSRESTSKVIVVKATAL